MGVPLDIQAGVRCGFDKVVIPPVPMSPTVAHTLRISLDGSSGEAIYDQVITFVPAEPLSIRLKPDYKGGTLTVSLDINGISSAMRAGAIGKAILLKDGKVVREPVKVSEFKDAVGKATFQTRSLADGDYVVCASVTDASGTVLAGKDTTLRLVAKPEWMNNSLGIDDSVPAPWTPLVVAHGGISCWNRTYDFGNSAFPKQITVGGVKLLTGPIELRGTSNGRALHWNNSVSARTHTGQSSVTFSTSAHSPDVNLSTVTTCDFDGFMRVDVTLSPRRGAKKIDKLVLCIPIDSSYAKYRYGYGNVAGGGLGMHLPTEKDIIGAVRTPWHSDFLPGLWIGDTSHGIGWYCEGQKNWSRKLPDNALSISSDGKSTVLQVNIIDTPIQLSGPITLSFGLQATPVKPFPRPKDWLTFRPVWSPGSNMFFEGWGGGTRWGGFPVVGDHSVPITDPKAYDDTAFKAEIVSRHAQGLFLPVYLNAGTMVLEIPEVQTYLEDWECTPVGTFDQRYEPADGYGVSAKQGMARSVPLSTEGFLRQIRRGRHLHGLWLLPEMRQPKTWLWL